MGNGLIDRFVLITERHGPEISSWASFIEFPTPEKDGRLDKKILLSSGSRNSPPVTTAVPL